jgi:hypothetical protein
MVWTDGITEVVNSAAKPNFLGKGGGSSASQNTYNYFASYAMAISEGPVDNILKVILDSKVVKDNTSITSFTKPHHDIELYPGTETQNPSALIQADKGADTPAFRGLAYLLFDLLPLLQYGNRIPNTIIIVATSALKIYPFTQFTRELDNPNPQTAGYQQMLIDHKRGYVYAWNEAYQSLEKFDYIRGTRVYTKTLTNAFLGTPEHIDSTYFGAVALLGDGNLIAMDDHNGGSATEMKIVNTDLGVVTDKIYALYNTSGGGLNVTTWPLMSFIVITLRSEVENWYYVDGNVGGGVMWSGRVGPFVTWYPTPAGGHYLLNGPEEYNRIGGSCEDGSLVNVWTVVYNTTGTGRLGLINANAIEITPFDKTDEEKRLGWWRDAWWTTWGYDIGGVDAEAPSILTDYPFYNANTEDLDVGTLKATWTTPWVCYNGTTDQIIIICPSLRTTGTGVDGWIGNFDPNTLHMTLTHGEADYTLETAPASVEFPIDPTFQDEYPQWSQIGGYTFDTMFSLRTSLTAGKGISILPWWWAGSVGLFGPPYEVRAIDPDTLAPPRRGRVWLSQFADILLSGSFVTLPRRDSIFIDGDVTSTNRAPLELFLDRAGAAVAPLEDVVGDLCHQCGLKAYQFDVSDLVGDFVAGFAISQRAAAKDNLSVLMLAYDFTYVESDWKIKFIKRGGATAFTIPERDLGVGDEEGEEEVLQLERTAEKELTMGLEVLYIDAGRDYQENVAEYKRTIDPVSAVNTTSRSTVQLPLVLTPYESAYVAKRSLGRLWAEHMTLQANLPPKYLGLDPADLVTITGDGVTHDTRALSADLGANRVIEYKSVIDDPELLNVDVIPVFGFQLDTSIAHHLDADFIMLDTSLLIDAHEGKTQNQFIVYTGIRYWRDTGFQGASAFIGISEFELSPWFTAGADDALDWGRAITALGYEGTGYDGNLGSDQTMDRINTVRVYLTKGNLESATDDEGFLNGDAVTGGVKGILGSEIIQAKTVTDLLDGTFLLSDLTRGRRGTEWAVPNHRVNEVFVPLYEDAPFALKQFPGSMVGNRGFTQRYVKIVSTGRANQDIEAEQVTFTAASLRPYSPCQVEGERDGSGNLNVRWVRRNRMALEYGWNRDEHGHLEMSEVWEKYEAALLVNTTFDVTDYSLWSESVVKKADLTFERQRDYGFTDNGDGTATITEESSPPNNVNFDAFTVGSWVWLDNFDDDDMNTYAIVLSTNGSTSMDLKIRDAGTDMFNNNSVITQMPTFTQFSAQELLDAGYAVTDFPMVVVYQMSKVIDRGRPGFDPLGLDRYSY